MILFIHELIIKTKYKFLLSIFIKNNNELLFSNDGIKIYTKYLKLSKEKVKELYHLLDVSVEKRISSNKKQKSYYFDVSINKNILKYKYSEVNKLQNLIMRYSKESDFVIITINR